MNRVFLCVLVLVMGCGKKDAAPAEPAPAKPAVSASASSASASAKPVEAGPLTLKGAYAAKQGEVRMPEDAPPFLHPDSKEGVGDGEVELTLPGGSGKEGPVVGKAKGALGAQLFTGWLEGDRLNGTLYPAEGATPAMWGLVEATVEGAGAARVVKGTIRVSGRDGKIVREAAFKLDQKG